MVDEAKQLGTDDMTKLQLEGLQILVVDDEWTNLKLMDLFLTSQGAHVEEVDSGEEGLKKAMVNYFDVIILDIQMPGIDGVETARRLRANGYKNGIIAFTAIKPELVEEAVMEAGCDAFLTKPMDRELMVSAILGQKERQQNFGSSNVISFQQKKSATYGAKSIYETDPLIKPLLGDFISRLKGNLEKMEDYLDESNWERLARLAHQVRGGFWDMVF